MMRCVAYSGPGNHEVLAQSHSVHARTRAQQKEISGFLHLLVCLLFSLLLFFFQSFSAASPVSIAVAPHQQPPVLRFIRRPSLFLSVASLSSSVSPLLTAPTLASSLLLLLLL